MRALVIGYQGKLPTIGEGVFLAPGVYVVGDVTVGDRASIWFGSVVRGDVNAVSIGAGSNVQDGCILHVTGIHPLRIGAGVTVGHGVILHGCTVEDGALVGIGARVLDGAIIRSGALVGAGTLVPPRAEIPAGMLAMGSPARVVRALTEEERRRVAESAGHYVGYAANYKVQLEA